MHADKKDRVSVSLTEAVKKAGCTLCHLSGKTKKGRYNAYGKQLAKLLKKGDDKDTKKIREALKKVFCRCRPIRTTRSHRPSAHGFTAASCPPATIRTGLLPFAASRFPSPPGEGWGKGDRRKLPFSPFRARIGASLIPFSWKSSP